MVAEQRLFSGDIQVGKNIMQLCCVDRTERKSTKFPKSFINHEEIYPLTEVPRPRFPSEFLTTNHKKLGESKRFISHVKCHKIYSLTVDNLERSL